MRGIQRQALLLQNCAASVCQDSCWMQAIAGQAEGYDAADLRVLADRALHAAARRQLASGLARHSPGALVVGLQELAEAQQGFQPAAAWGVGHLQVLPFSCLSIWACVCAQSLREVSFVISLSHLAFQLHF